MVLILYQTPFPPPASLLSWSCAATLSDSACSLPRKLESLHSWNPDPLKFQVFHEKSVLLESTVSTLLLSSQLCIGSWSYGVKWVGGSTDRGQESKMKAPPTQWTDCPDVQCKHLGEMRLQADQGRGTETQFLKRCSLLSNMISILKGTELLHYPSRLFVLQLLFVRPGICTCT